MPRTAPLPSLLVSVLVAACAATDPSRPEIDPSPEARTIARLEDARDEGHGVLRGFLSHERAEVRARAAMALGRLPYPEHGKPVTEALLAALTDPEPVVRSSAAFALGVRRDPAAGDALASLALDFERRDAEADVRAAAMEAASKLDRPDLHLRLLMGFYDVDPAVRAETAVATHRWDRALETAAAVDQALIVHADRERVADVVDAVLFALQRRRSAAGRAVFLAHVGSERAAARIWAARGLAALEPDPEVAAGLRETVRDADWRVACEAALGLAECDDEASRRALFAATRSRNKHVERNAWTAIGQALAGSGNWPETLRNVPWGDSPSAVAARVVAIAKAVGPRLEGPSAGGETTRARTASATTGGIELLRTKLEMLGPWALEILDAAGSASPVVRAGAAEAAGHLPTPVAVPLLLELAEDEDVTVAGTALSSLGAHADEAGRRRLREALSDEDNGIRLAAVLAIGEAPTVDDLAWLERAFDTTSGDIGPEVRFNVLRVAAKVESEGALRVLTAGLLDDEPYVRRVATEELQARGKRGSALAPSISAAPAAPTRTPLAGVDYPVYEVNPRVEVETNRGKMVFELFPGEAPVHVHNFLTLVDRDHYDDLPFHRVVPDFVVQGGDYRGDGNGGTTWRGIDSLGHEVGRRKYVRGSLGMPRNEDWDSGGSQVFVTHRATPHLDGRYTLFGQLVDGVEVLDAIEVGDRIVDVTQLEGR